jgi:serine/threonine-protein phosphatase PGAM5
MFNKFSRFFVRIIPIFLIVALIPCQDACGPKETRGVRTIYLIRHGDYSPQDDNDPDSIMTLTPLGIAQARLVAERLKSMNVKFDSLTSSTMTRAKQTAMTIHELFPELKLGQSDLIRECTPPTWRKDVMAGVDTAKCQECVKNLERAFKECFIPSPDDRNRNDIIVCHGNVIRYFVMKVLNADTMAWLQMSITNCSVTIIRIFPAGTMKLDAFGDYGHIPENMRTLTGGNNESKELSVKTGEGKRDR